jgi:hypothetical protein
MALPKVVFLGSTEGEHNELEGYFQPHVFAIHGFNNGICQRKYFSAQWDGILEQAQ